VADPAIGVGGWGAPPPPRPSAVNFVCIQQGQQGWFIYNHQTAAFVFFLMAAVVNVFF